VGEIVAHGQQGLLFLTEEIRALVVDKVLYKDIGHLRVEASLWGAFFNLFFWLIGRWLLPVFETPSEHSGS